MKKIISICITLIVISLTSCEIDNYVEPNGHLTGRVIDAVTGKPIITEQPAGFRVRYQEISWGDNAQLQSFWGKADGTFNHTKLFAGSYLVNVIEGAFPEPNPQMVRIQSGKTSTVEFTVTPYISFSEVSIVKEDNTVRATFTLSKNVKTSVLESYRVFATKATPYVGTEMFDDNVSTGTVNIKDSDLGIPISVLLPANFVAGKTYYIRIGARCLNAQNRYNMTEVVKIQM